MAATVCTDLRELPSEIFVKIMACMSSPIALLDFLTTFTSVIELFENFHMEILPPVLISESPPGLQQRIAEEAPSVSYDVALASWQDAERWTAPALRVAKLKKPHLTLMRIVLEYATGRRTMEAKRLGKELEEMGADVNVCYELTRYWTFRLVHEDAVAVFARGPTSSAQAEADPVVEQNLKQRSHLTWQQKDEIRKGRFGVAHTASSA
ncbi:MAG: hypothetical protein Q9191_002296 [Dirinaria sp. TL-2023a]